MNESDYVMLAFIVPVTHADHMREALGKAGIGKVENYSHCSFSTKGTGRFRPQEGANPHIGDVGRMEIVEEEKIQTYCKKTDLEDAIRVIKRSHPYEEMVIEVLPIYACAIKSLC